MDIIKFQNDVFTEDDTFFHGLPFFTYINPAQAAESIPDVVYSVETNLSQVTNLLGTLDEGILGVSADFRYDAKQELMTMSIYASDGRMFNKPARDCPRIF